MKAAPNLSADEILYFYNLLYLLERTTKYEGFNIQRIGTKISKSIELNSNYGKDDFVPKPEKKNTLNYRGKSGKTKNLLKHIRNSYAHGLIESRGKEFYILDVPKSKVKEVNLEQHASMIGSMSKEIFYKMIEVLLNKNPLIQN